MAPRLGRLAVTQKHSNVDAAACPGTLVPNSLALGSSATLTLTNLNEIPFYHETPASHVI